MRRIHRWPTILPIKGQHFGRRFHFMTSSRNLSYLISGIYQGNVIWLACLPSAFVLNHQPHDCLLKRLFRRRSKKTTTSLHFETKRLVAIFGTIFEPDELASIENTTPDRTTFFFVIQSIWVFTFSTRNAQITQRVSLLHDLISKNVKGLILAFRWWNTFKFSSPSNGKSASCLK